MIRIRRNKNGYYFLSVFICSISVTCVQFVFGSITNCQLSIVNSQFPADTLNYVLGKFDPANDTRFIRIENKYGSDKEMYLRKEVYEAFIKMYEAAKAEGVYLKIISATRNFSKQKKIWEDKWTGKHLVNGKNLSQTVKDPVERAKMILRYSSMPCISRHHWGTDVDLNTLENAHFNTVAGKQLYEWLQHHAAQFGFCQPYSSKTAHNRTGYEEEKWHWSYIPLAAPLLKYYLNNVKPQDIKGFEGSETATDIDVITKYVGGVNKDCY